MVQRWRGKYVLMLVVVTTLISTVISFIIKEDLRRLTYGTDDEALTDGKRRPSWARKKQESEVELKPIDSPSPAKKDINCSN